MNSIKNALLQSGLISEKDIKKSNHTKQKKSTKRDQPRISDLTRQVVLSQIIIKELQSRPPEKIICHKCGAEGYSILEAAVIHHELVEEYVNEGNGLEFILKAKQFGLELRKRVEEKFGNIISKYGCWKCPVNKTN